MKKSLFIIILISFIVLKSNAQNIVITDDNAYTAHSSAMLDVKSLTRGMLVPRMTSSQRNAIVSPANGLLVFDTNLNEFFYYTGSVWTNLSYGQLWTKNGNYVYLSNTDNNVGIGVTDPNNKLLVKADATTGIDESIFAVLNNNGDTVFAVYQEGVRIWVDDNGGSKANGSRGGFAVGGFSPTKAGFTNEYLRVTPDSVRIYIDDDYVPAKANGSRGGFAVGGFSPTKGTATDNYLFVQDDSTRVYTMDTDAGFGVANINSPTPENYMHLNPNNSLIGHQAGHSIQTGMYNSYIGYFAGYMDNGGYRNVFIGHESGYSNNGSNFMGTYYLGSENTFMGYRAGYHNNHGASNTFIGNQAGFNNTGYNNITYMTVDGSHNVFIGDQAGYYNTIGNSNVFVGERAGYRNVDGGFNVFLGMYSGHQHQNGSHNVFLGYGAGYDDVSGVENVYLGKNSGENNNGSANIFIGRSSGGSETATSNKFFLDNASNGPTQAFMYGELNPYVAGGRYLRLNEKMGINTIPSFDLHIVNTNATISLNLLEISDMGSYNLGVDGDLVPYVSTTYDIGNNVATEHWDEMWANAYQTFSDINLKKNIEDLDFGLSELMALRPVKYQYIKEIDNDDRLRFGLIAQDVEKIIPSIVIDEDVDIDPQTGEKIVTKSEYKGLNYTDLIPVLIKATQEQQKIIEEQQITIQSLIERIEKLDKK